MNLIFRILAWAAFATLPTEILSQALGWQPLSPESAIAEVLWLPVALYGQLQLLGLLSKNKPRLSPASALGSSIGVNILMALRFLVVFLLWELPALIAFSLMGLETFRAKFIVLALCLTGAIQPALWFLRRMCALPIVLWQGLRASAALDESARLSQGKLKSVLVPLLLWNIAAQALEGLGLLSNAVNLAVLPLSLILSTAALAIAYCKLRP